MKLIIDGLNIWRENRNINKKEFVMDDEVANLLEECTEYLRAKNEYEQIDALCDVGVFGINGYCIHPNKEEYIYDLENSLNIYETKVDIYDILEILSRVGRDGVIDISIIDYSFSMMNQMGYDYKKCMLETIKEISSREQDPIQKEEWLKNGPSGKWQKNKQQNPDTLYKADYESCKL